ncbi:site-specific recombinase XerD [Bradyrhizobium sp. GM24.11]
MRKPSASKPSDAKLIGLFLDMLAAEQGAGPNTLDAYRRDLTDFSEFLGRVGHSFVDAETQVLRDYLGDLDARGFKSSSVARRLSAMRHLFRFLLNERIRTEDPAAILSGPKRGRGLPKVLSIADVDRMLRRAKEMSEAPDDSPSQRLRALRLYCLLEVLYATGLRVSELVSLPRSAAKRDARMIVVRGKGDKERLVPLNEASRQAMADYLAATEAAKENNKGEKKGSVAASKWLFPSFGESGHLTRQHFAPRLEGARGRFGASGPPGLPARATARLCQPPPAQRRGLAHRADPARPHRHLDDPDLYPCGRGAAEEPGARPAPAGGEVRRSRAPDAAQRETVRRRAGAHAACWVPALRSSAVEALQRVRDTRSSIGTTTETALTSATSPRKEPWPHS